MHFHCTTINSIFDMSLIAIIKMCNEKEKSKTKRSKTKVFRSPS